MGGEIVAVTGSQSPALLSSARRSVLDRATAPQSSALRNPDNRWGSRGDLRPLRGAEVVTPEEPHPFETEGHPCQETPLVFVGSDREVDVLLCPQCINEAAWRHVDIVVRDDMILRHVEA